MRTRLFAAVIITALCFCSCSGRESAKPCDIDEKFEGTVKITQGSSEYSCELKRADADVWEMQYTSPKTIEGLKLTFTGSVCTLDLQGLKYELEREDIPAASPASVCCGALEDLIAKKDLTCTKDGDTVTEKGSHNGSEMTAVFEKGTIKELTVSDQLRFEFSF